MKKNIIYLAILALCTLATAPSFAASQRQMDAERHMDALSEQYYGANATQAVGLIKEALRSPGTYRWIEDKDFLNSFVAKLNKETTTLTPRALEALKTDLIKNMKGKLPQAQVTRWNNTLAPIKSKVAVPGRSAVRPAPVVRPAVRPAQVPSSVKAPARMRPAAPAVRPASVARPVARPAVAPVRPASVARPVTRPVTRPAVTPVRPAPAPSFAKAPARMRPVVAAPAVRPAPVARPAFAKAPAGMPAVRPVVRPIAAPVQRPAVAPVARPAVRPAPAARPAAAPVTRSAAPRTTPIIMAPRATSAQREAESAAEQRRQDAELARARERARQAQEREEKIATQRTIEQSAMEKEARLREQARRAQQEDERNSQADQKARQQAAEALERIQEQDRKALLERQAELERKAIEEVKAAQQAQKQAAEELKRIQEQDRKALLEREAELLRKGVEEVKAAEQAQKQAEEEAQRKQVLVRQREEEQKQSAQQAAQAQEDERKAQQAAELAKKQLKDAEDRDRAAREQKVTQEEQKHIAQVLLKAEEEDKKAVEKRLQEETKRLEAEQRQREATIAAEQAATEAQRAKDEEAQRAQEARAAQERAEQEKAAAAQRAQAARLAAEKEAQALEQARQAELARQKAAQETKRQQQEAQKRQEEQIKQERLAQQARDEEAKAKLGAQKAEQERQAAEQAQQRAVIQAEKDRTAQDLVAKKQAAQDAVNQLVALELKRITEEEAAKKSAQASRDAEAAAQKAREAEEKQIQELAEKAEVARVAEEERLQQARAAEQAAEKIEQERAKRLEKQKAREALAEKARHAEERALNRIAREKQALKDKELLVYQTNLAKQQLYTPYIDALIKRLYVALLDNNEEYQRVFRGLLKQLDDGISEATLRDILFALAKGDMQSVEINLQKRQAQKFITEEPFNYITYGNLPLKSDLLQFAIKDNLFPNLTEEFIQATAGYDDLRLQYTDALIRRLYTYPILSESRPRQQDFRWILQGIKINDETRITYLKDLLKYLAANDAQSINTNIFSKFRQSSGFGNDFDYTDYEKEYKTQLEQFVLRNNIFPFMPAEDRVTQEKIQAVEQEVAKTPEQRAEERAERLRQEQARAEEAETEAKTEREARRQQAIAEKGIRETEAGTRAERERQAEMKAEGEIQAEERLEREERVKRVTVAADRERRERLAEATVAASEARGEEYAERAKNRELAKQLAEEERTRRVAEIAQTSKSEEARREFEEKQVAELRESDIQAAREEAEGASAYDLQQQVLYKRYADILIKTLYEDTVLATDLGYRKTFRGLLDELKKDVDIDADKRANLTNILKALAQGDVPTVNAIFAKLGAGWFGFGSDLSYDEYRNSGTAAQAQLPDYRTLLNTFIKDENIFPNLTQETVDATAEYNKLRVQYVDALIQKLYQQQIFSHEEHRRTFRWILEGAVERKNKYLKPILENLAQNNISPINQIFEDQPSSTVYGSDFWLEDYEKGFKKQVQQFVIEQNIFPLFEITKLKVETLQAEVAVQAAQQAQEIAAQATKTAEKEVQQALQEEEKTRTETGKVPEIALPAGVTTEEEVQAAAGTEKPASPQQTPLLLTYKPKEEERKEAAVATAGDEIVREYINTLVLTLFNTKPLIEDKIYRSYFANVLTEPVKPQVQTNIKTIFINYLSKNDLNGLSDYLQTRASIIYEQTLQISDYSYQEYEANKAQQETLYKVLKGEIADITPDQLAATKTDAQKLIQDNLAQLKTIQGDIAQKMPNLNDLSVLQSTARNIDKALAILSNLPSDIYNNAKAMNFPEIKRRYLILRQTLALKIMGTRRQEPTATPASAQATQEPTAATAEPEVTPAPEASAAAQPGVTPELRLQYADALIQKLFNESILKDDAGYRRTFRYLLSKSTEPKIKNDLIVILHALDQDQVENVDQEFRKLGKSSMVTWYDMSYQDYRKERAKEINTLVEKDPTLFATTTEKAMKATIAEQQKKTNAATEEGETGEDEDAAMRLARELAD
ncbi:MAG TPA: hypothetical protein VGT41_04260 [Candidatus Babeliales bacterium]|nr:hypothetical protein [Candidatus Babeliales bacterium]